MARPAIRTERFTVLLTPAELKKLEAWAKKNRIKTLGEAARSLMALGMAAPKGAKQLCEASE